MLALLLATLANAADVEVAFPGAAGLELHGTLRTAERAEGRAPAVLLLPGSGPTDRNGNQPPLLITDTLKMLAEGLSDLGYVTLRFDKRAAHVHASDWPLQADAVNEFFAWDRFVGDASAAFAFLASRPEVNPEKVAILGHSEGGIIALQAAPTLKAVAFVLAGTPARPLKAVVHDQIAAALKAQGANEEQTTYFLDRCDTLCDEFIQDGRATSDIPPGLAALFPASAAKYLQSVLGLDPKVLAKSVKSPVLVVNGELDGQVSATKDAAPLHEALKARAGGASELAILEGASHNLKVPGPEDPAGLTGPLHPKAVSTIAEWLDRVLRS